MRSLYISLICLLLISSCKDEKKEAPIEIEETDISFAELIANAHGYENWKNVEKVEFTFKVDRDTIKGQGRSWVWHPKEDKVKMTIGETIIEYARSEMDSTHIRADQGFINDKYWFLLPFQLIWDDYDATIEPMQAAPISKMLMSKMTIVYPDEGGYTPGDAYDIYFDENYIIKEWVFRQGNSSEPSLTNTFENYKDFNGIKIAIDHKKEDGKWNLNFADVSITLNNK